MPLPAPTLPTARLRPRPFDDADADALFALHSSAYVLRYWDAPPWSDRARAERFIAACRQLAEAGTGARLAIDRVSDGVFIGLPPECPAGISTRGWSDAGQSFQPNAFRSAAR